MFDYKIIFLCQRWQDGPELSPSQLLIINVLKKGLFKFNNDPKLLVKSWDPS